MMAPDAAVFERLHAAARGQLRILTLAPELPGAGAVIQAATRAGVTVAVGHTDATAEVTLAAIDAGATTRPTCSTPCGRRITASRAPPVPCWTGPRSPAR